MQKFYYDFGTGIFECFFAGEIVFFRCAVGPNKNKAFTMISVIDFYQRNPNIKIYDSLDSIMGNEV